MEPLEFRPKHSYQFWLMIGWFCFQFFCQTIHTNRRFLEDPSSLPNNLIILVFITAAIAFLFRVNVKRVTIEDRIIIEHYLAKPIEQEPEDFVAIAGGVIHLKDYAIDTTQFRNGKRLLRAFEKRIAAGILPLGGEAPQQPQEENNNRRGRLFRWLFWLPLLIYIAASIALANIKNFTLPPYLSTVAWLLMLGYWLGLFWFETKQTRGL